MAKILFGNIAADARGSTGGVVFSRNRNGAYVRQKVSPVQPRTYAQTQLRTILSGLAKAWRALTDGQRTTWAVLGASCTRTDALGQAYNLTGLQAFVMQNVQRQIQGDAVQDTANPLSDAAILGAPITTADKSANSVEISPLILHAPTTPGRVVVFATAPMSPGKTYISNSKYRQVGIFATDTAGPWDISDNYNALYGNVANYAVGQKIGIKVLVYDSNDNPRTDIRATTAIVA